MILNREVTINATNTFKKELKNIVHYIRYQLKEPLIADKIYKKVVKEISTLNYMPERHKRVQYFYNPVRNIRKMLIDNYIIIYELDKNTRTSFYFTYFSRESKLFKSIIIKI